MLERGTKTPKFCPVNAFGFNYTNKIPKNGLIFVLEK